MKEEKIYYASESFLNSVNDLPKDLCDKLRYLKKKLFIPEESLSSILDFYQEWLAKNGAGNYSYEKLIQRVFGSESLVLSYLPEGNDCFIGYIVRISEDALVEFPNIKFSNSVAIGAQDYLHPKDPSINQINNIEIKRPQNKAPQIWFKIGDNRFYCVESFLRRFAHIARVSKKTKEIYPNINRSLKDVLLPMQDTLKSSKSLRKYRPCLVPEKYKDDSEIEMKIGFSTVFVFRGEEIIDLFETRGYGFENLLESELTYLFEKKNLKSIDVLQLITTDKKVIGKLKIAGKWYAIDKRGFRFFLENIHASQWFKGKLAPVYTLRNVLEVFVPALKNADWINTSLLGRQAANIKAENAKQKANYELKYTPWTFVTGRNYTIVDFIESGVRSGSSFKKPVNNFSNKEKESKKESK